MAVFSIVAVPLAYLIVASILYSELQLKRETWKVFFTSMLCSAPFFIILSEFRGGRLEIFSMGSLYFHSLLNEHLFLAVFPSALYVVFLHFFPLYREDADPDNASHKALTFFAGFYSLTVLTDFLLFAGFSDYYQLFLLPCLRIGSITAIALGFSKYIHETGWRKYLFPILGLLSTAAAAVPSMLYLGNYTTLALLATLLFLGASLGAFYFWRKY